jgi:hypothetical protein
MSENTSTTPSAPVTPPAPTSTSGFIERANAALLKHFGNAQTETTTTATVPSEGTTVPDLGTPDDGAPLDTAPWLNQPRNADGTFAPKDETEATTQTEPVASPTSGEPQAEAETEETPQAEVVALPPTREGQAEVEIEVTDPNIAEHLRHLANNGLRSREFTRRMANVEAREAELRQIESALKVAPEVFVADLAPEVRPRLVKYLLAQHFEEIAPVIEQWWTNDTARREYLLDERTRVDDSKKELDANVLASRKAGEVRRAVVALIPEDVEQQDADDFVRDAMGYLTDLSMRDRKVIEPTEVPALLDRHRRRYGFAEAAVSGNGTSSTARKAPLPPRVVARPVGDTAQRLAEARAKQDRLRESQAQRNAASRVAPVGQGAVPASKPVYTPGQGFDKASAFVKKHINTFGKPAA